LNRLATAQATNSAWGNSYSYDGFGNLPGMIVTAGSAPNLALRFSVQAISSKQYHPHDASGLVRSVLGVSKQLAI
jgi:hypothetical protein